MWIHYERTSDNACLGAPDLLGGLRTLRHKQCRRKIMKEKGEQQRSKNLSMLCESRSCSKTSVFPERGGDGIARTPGFFARNDSNPQLYDTNPPYPNPVVARKQTVYCSNNKPCASRAVLCCIYTLSDINSLDCGWLFSFSLYGSESPPCWFMAVM